MMKAKTATILDTRRAKANGNFPIKLRITFERKQVYFTLPYDLNKSDFEKVMFGKRLTEREKVLKSKITAYENKAIGIIDKLPAFTFLAFEKQYHTNRGTKGTIEAAFAEYITELRESERIGTAVSYECAQRSLQKFMPNAKFSDITPDTLLKYEKWMLAQDNSITTVGIYLRSLRTLFNNAISF